MDCVEMTLENVPARLWAALTEVATTEFKTPGEVAEEMLSVACEADTELEDDL